MPSTYHWYSNVDAGVHVPDVTVAAVAVMVAFGSTEFTKVAKANMIDVQKGLTSMMGSANQGTTSGAGSAFDFFSQAMVAGQNAFKEAQASAINAFETVKKATK